MNVKIFLNLVVFFFLLILRVTEPEASNPPKSTKFYGEFVNSTMKPENPPKRTFIIKPK